MTDNIVFVSCSKKESQCFDQLTTFIGVTLCTDYSITNPTAVPGAGNVALFPLNGPNSVALWLEVEQEYEFNVNQEINDKFKAIEATFNTPNTQTNRKTVVRGEYGIHPNIYTRVTLDSPHYQLSAEAGFINDDKEMSVYGKATSREGEHLGKLGFTKSGSDTRQEYKPIVIWKTPKKTDDNIKGYKVTGSITVDAKDGGKRYSFNKLQVVSTVPDPFTVNGWLEIVGAEIKADLQLSGDGKTGSIKGGVKFDPDNLSIDLGVKNNFAQYANGRIVFKLNKEKDHVSDQYLKVTLNGM